MKSIATVLVPAALALSSFAAVAAPAGSGSAFGDDPFSQFDRYQVSATSSSAQVAGTAVRSDDPFGGFNDVAEAPKSTVQSLSGPVNRDDPFAGFNDHAGASAKPAAKAATPRAAQPRPASWSDPFVS
jgi:hypothetical protein